MSFVELIQLSPTIFLLATTGSRGTEPRRRIESRDRFQLRSLRQKGHAARLWTDFLLGPIVASRRRIARFPRPFRLFLHQRFFFSRDILFRSSRLVSIAILAFLSATAINPFTSYDIARDMWSSFFFQCKNNFQGEYKSFLFRQERVKTYFFFTHIN